MAITDEQARSLLDRYDELVKVLKQMEVDRVKIRLEILHIKKKLATYKPRVS